MFLELTKVHAKALTWLSRATVSSDSRYTSLKRINKRLSGWYAATDGHRLHMEYIDEDNIPSEFVLTKVGSKTNPNLVEVEIPEDIDTNKFPNVEKLIPTEDRYCVAINAAFLIDLLADLPGPPTKYMVLIAPDISKAGKRAPRNRPVEFLIRKVFPNDDKPPFIERYALIMPINLERDTWDVIPIPRPELHYVQETTNDGRNDTNS